MVNKHGNMFKLITNQKCKSRPSLATMLNIVDLQFKSLPIWQCQVLPRMWTDNLCILLREVSIGTSL